MPQTAEQHKFSDKYDAILLTVTSNGMTGKQWFRRLRKKGYRVSDLAKSILYSADFKPTSGVTNQLVVLKGTFFERDRDRETKNIRAYADSRGWTKPNAEVACLIREMFTNKEIEAMGLWWIVVMHEPIKDSDGDPSLLDADRKDDEDGHGLDATWGELEHRWSRSHGFAFVVPQQA